MKAEIQGLFTKAVEISGSVGAQLSIIKDGEQLDFVHGLANAELDIPMTADTVIQIGSATKVWNAALIMTLVDEGKLDLDTPVKRYLPELELSDPKAAETITLRQLLSMSSGIDNGDYADYGVGEDAVAKRVAALKTLPQHFAPGTGFGYSNAGTDIAGRVAERVTGRLWDHLLQERIVQPLGLKNAVSLDRERMYQRVSVGHVRDPQTGAVSLVHPWCLSRGSGPAGSTMTASAHDLVRFGHMFVDKGMTSSGKRILSESAVRTMMTKQVDVPVHCYGTGWCVGPGFQEWDGVGVWGHPGGNASGTSYFFWLPERNGAIAFVSNMPSTFLSFVKVMTREIMKTAFGVAKPIVTAPATPVKIDPERYVGDYDSLGGRCEITFADGKLIAKKITRDFTNEASEAAEIVTLVPLGDDRFLVDKGEASDPHVLPEDMAFFGIDGQGRATNVTPYVFPQSRKSSRNHAARE